MGAHILVPFDGSKHSLKALHIASDLAVKYKCGVRVLVIVPSSRKADRTARTKAEGLISTASEKLSKLGVDGIETEIEFGDIAEGIVFVASRHKMKIIVMGCRGVKEGTETATGGTKQFGSVSQKVFQLADCTCISVK